ncbi:MAG: hypothetical protein JJU18_04940 [Oceanicaulis sp.]|nr:hypothetical protein [Oceanicaulis sp.]
MGALLIGDTISEEIIALNYQLRHKTLTYSQSKFRVITPKYTPWLCFSPVVDDMPESLLINSFEHDGRILSDSNKIDVLSKFISGPGKICLQGLPGEKSDWVPKLHEAPDRFQKSVDIIESSSLALKTLYSNIVDVIIPLGGGRNRGYSTHYARGAIFRSLPSDNNEFDVAFDIVHELGHQSLMIWQSIDPILASEPDAPVYSQIRKRDRPAIQSLHAAVALAYMLFLKQQSQENKPMIDAAARRGATYSTNLEKSLELAIASIRDKCDLTDIGHAIVEEMELFNLINAIKNSIQNANEASILMMILFLSSKFELILIFER